jgi:hypothetical protein
MNSGMLWYDNDPQSNLIKRIQTAAAYFIKKYGTKPDVCFIHPSMLAEEIIGELGMEVRKNYLIRPNYFWLESRKPT